MNKDKVIKGLKERNDKLFDQYRNRDFRCIALELRIKRAIEYIENNTYSSAHSLKTTLYLQNDELYALLEILKGGKNNG